MAFPIIAQKTMRKRLSYFITFCFLLTAFSGQSQSGKLLKTVSLAPHITELIYAVGGGDTLVAVSAYSNFPKQASEKAIIGDAFRIDLEQMIALQPDLIFYWHGTTSQQVLRQLKQHNLKTVAIKIDTLSDIGQAMLVIATQLNLPQPAAYHQFKSRLNNLQQSTHDDSRSVFIQLSQQPLYTVSSQHWMSEAASLCGLQNIFSELPTTAATVSQEAVIGHNPDVIIAMQAVNENNPLQQWPQITAIKQQHIAIVDPDTFSRPTPRILDAVDNLCQQVNQFSDAAGE
ncbi:MAG: hypothetical protein DWP95_07895 [Proteobacteria bacterium]|nr:MAG: hypothetical protein DWP95_07895 [Pseudomonadota bacterium]